MAKEQQPAKETYDARAGGSWKFSGPGALLRYWTRAKGASGFGSGTTAQEAAKRWDGKGKVAIVTGPYTGIGLATARELACRGCEVVLAGRTKGSAKDRGENWIKREILDKCPGKRGKVSAIELDLSSLKSVRTFAEEFKRSGKDLNLLVNNAGVMAIPAFTKSKDGFEMQFATNHLGHFLLTHLLLDKMKASAKKPRAPQGRIVNLSSSAHFMGYKPEGILPAEDLHSEKKYHDWKAYGQSKLSNLLHARELNARLAEEDPESRVIAVGVHPGVIATDLQRHIQMPAFVRYFAHAIASPGLKSIDQGAATTVYCATAPHIAGGEFYSDCNVQGSSDLSKDRSIGRRLWRISEEHCKAFMS